MHLIEQFLQFEEDNNLFNLSIYGIKFWSAVRFNIYNSIYKLRYKTESNHPSLNKTSIIKKIYFKIAQVNNFISKNPMWFLRQKDILVLNHSRRVFNGKSYECIYTDELLKNLKWSYYVFEEPYYEKHFKKIETENIRYLDYVNFKAALKKIYFKLTKKYIFKEEQKKDIEKLINRINKEFDVSLNKEEITSIIQNYILSYKAAYDYYLKILNVVQPKVILEVVSYGRSRYIINEIAKIKGIKVIELQHGAMGKYHVAYNFFKKRNISTFPDYIFTFGEYWNNVTRFPIDDSRIIATGFPYYDKKTIEYKNENSIEEDKKIILFISQGAIGKSLSKFACELNKIIDKKNYRIIFKLHPSEYSRWKSEYLCLKESGIEVIDNNLKDIYYFLSKSYCQVGVSSTAIFEGLGFNLKTYIVKLPGYEYFEDLIRIGYVKLVDSAEAIVEDLNVASYNVDYDSGKFYRKNSLFNINNSIQSLID